MRMKSQFNLAQTRKKKLHRTTIIFIGWTAALNEWALNFAQHSYQFLLSSTCFAKWLQAAQWREEPQKLVKSVHSSNDDNAQFRKKFSHLTRICDSMHILIVFFFWIIFCCSRSPIKSAITRLRSIVFRHTTHSSFYLPPRYKNNIQPTKKPCWTMERKIWKKYWNIQRESAAERRSQAIERSKKS